MNETNSVFDQNSKEQNVSAFFKNTIIFSKKKKTKNTYIKFKKFARVQSYLFSLN